MKKYTKILCVDFDGVLHSYKTGWHGPRIVADAPVPGAIDWLRTMIYSHDFVVCIYSSRSKQWGGKRAMKGWLNAHGLSNEELALIKFPTKKPAAFLTIDDRAICFDGNFPSIDELLNFKPWNKREV